MKCSRHNAKYAHVQRHNETIIQMHFERNWRQERRDNVMLLCSFFFSFWNAYTVFCVISSPNGRPQECIFLKCYCLMQRKSTHCVAFICHNRLWYFKPQFIWKCIYLVLYLFYCGAAHFVCIAHLSLLICCSNVRLIFNSIQFNSIYL